MPPKQNKKLSSAAIKERVAQINGLNPKARYLGNNTAVRVLRPLDLNEMLEEKPENVQSPSSKAERKFNAFLQATTNANDVVESFNNDIAGLSVADAVTSSLTASEKSMPADRTTSNSVSSQSSSDTESDSSCSLNAKEDAPDHDDTEIDFSTWTDEEKLAKISQLKLEIETLKTNHEYTMSEFAKTKDSLEQQTQSLEDQKSRLNVHQQKLAAEQSKLEHELEQQKATDKQLEKEVNDLEKQTAAQNKLEEQLHEDEQRYNDDNAQYKLAMEQLKQDQLKYEKDLADFQKREKIYLEQKRIADSRSLALRQETHRVRVDLQQVEESHEQLQRDIAGFKSVKAEQELLLKVQEAELADLAKKVRERQDVVKLHTDLAAVEDEIRTILQLIEEERAKARERKDLEAAIQSSRNSFALEFVSQAETKAEASEVHIKEEQQATISNEVAELSHGFNWDSFSQEHVQQAKRSGKKLRRQNKM